jgi:hypothetical protein
MEGEHGSGDAGCRAGIAIAGVGDTRPGNELAETVIADMSIAEEEGIGAEKAVVVQGLDDSDAVRACGRVNGGRRSREEVVNVEYLRFQLGERGADELI